jgi:hypothetical protein
VREWVKQAERDAGTGDGGLTGDERRELAELRRENRRLREDAGILKRATAFCNVKRACELQVRLLRSARGRAVRPGPAGRRAGRPGQGGVRGIEGPLRLSAGPRSAAGAGPAALRKRVARLMRDQGLQGRAAKRWKKTTIRTSGG